MTRQLAKELDLLQRLKGTSGRWKSGDQTFEPEDEDEEAWLAELQSSDCKTGYLCGKRIRR